MKYLFTIFTFLSISAANAQVYTWQGTPNDNWSNADNWKIDQVSTLSNPLSPIPTRCSQVIIPKTARKPKLYNDVFVGNIQFDQSGSGADTNVAINLNNKNISIGFTDSPAELIYVPIKNGELQQYSFDDEYKSQNASLTTNDAKSYGLGRSISSCAPIYRFELHPDDHFIFEDTDNTQNGGQKERTELKGENRNFEFGVDIWVSYSIYIEPGGTVKYDEVKEPDFYCTIGQWHTDDERDGAAWEFEFIDEVLRLKTRGGDPTNVKTFKHVERARQTLSRGVWHDIVVKARHNPDSQLGHITWWLDKNPTPKFSGNVSLGTTRDVNEGNRPGYWKFGIYRTPASITPVDERVILSVRYANVEVSEASLLDRVTNPLPRD